MSKSALVFGASGVTGWSFINEILQDYPKSGTWKCAHALTNRPLSQEQSQWPNDPRLNIVSGIDLLAGSQKDLETELQSKIPNIKEVTHVYYLAYKAGTDIQKEPEEAVEMWKKTLLAVDKLCLNLEFVVLQTGAKMYGCHLLATVQGYSQPHLKTPHKESQGRLEGRWGEMLFYHPQLDFIADLAKERKWSWCDTRPDIIIGFVPNQNFYSLGSSMGIYLSLWREVHGKGSQCPFPGTEKSWKALSQDSSSDMIARQTIHLSLDKNTEKGGGYNVADEKTPSSWSAKWPTLCSLFGLEGTGPTPNPPEMRKFIKDHIDVWHGLEKQHGLQTGHADSERVFPGFEYFLMTQFDFDRQYDMNKMYSTGFDEERGTKRAWGGVFDRMRKAKIIP
ncbi:hypothetical protein HBI56_071490 [Parastagonospora nodorum]|nr:hypothetical protein HBI10_085780 [Parastagonospora nodorum]KAH4027132.1 hypothetical protein HBI13_054790 [Parastagonospora nodorum]KAH4810433.1 hypothetical protein HBH61_103420 [Parastagonospora nodorum]KAH4914840.1 hypothetical protein HBH74_148510 [Parastagonospora nodorum]KAH4974412.1 hypothetical protein HBH73_047210 [Parastagonospora nodorum]